MAVKALMGCEMWVSFYIRIKRIFKMTSVCSRPQSVGASTPAGAVRHVHEGAGWEETGQSHGPGQSDHQTHHQGNLHEKNHNTITDGQINGVASTDLDTNNVSAHISRRALYPGSPSPLRVVTTCRTWTQTRRVCATCVLTTDVAKPKFAGTPCPPFCLSLSCKRTSCQLVLCLPFRINRKAVLRVIYLFFAHLRDSNRVFKNSPHARQMKNSSVMTPPPIHINGKGNREVRTILTGNICSGLFQVSSYLWAASCCELIQSVHFKQCGLLFELNSHLTRVADFSLSPTQRKET